MTLASAQRLDISRGQAERFMSEQLTLAHEIGEQFRAEVSEAQGIHLKLEVRVLRWRMGLEHRELTLTPTLLITAPEGKQKLVCLTPALLSDYRKHQVYQMTWERHGLQTPPDKRPFLSVPLASLATPEQRLKVSESILESFSSKHRQDLKELQHEHVRQMRIGVINSAVTSTLAATATTLFLMCLLSFWGALLVPLFGTLILRSVLRDHTRFRQQQAAQLTWQVNAQSGETRLLYVPPDETGEAGDASAIPEPPPVLSVQDRPDPLSMALNNTTLRLAELEQELARLTPQSQTQQRELDELHGRLNALKDTTHTQLEEQRQQRDLESLRQRISTEEHYLSALIGTDKEPPHELHF